MLSWREETWGDEEEGGVELDQVTLIFPVRFTVQPSTETEKVVSV